MKLEKIIAASRRAHLVPHRPQLVGANLLPAAKLIVELAKPTRQLAQTISDVLIEHDVARRLRRFTERILVPGLQQLRQHPVALLIRKFARIDDAAERAQRAYLVWRCEAVAESALAGSGDQAALERFAVEDVGLKRTDWLDLACALVETNWREANNPLSYLRGAVHKSRRWETAREQCPLLKVSQRPWLAEPEMQRQVARRMHAQPRDRLLITELLLDAPFDEPEAYAYMDARYIKGAPIRALPDLLGWDVQRVERVRKSTERRIAAFRGKGKKVLGKPDA